MSPRVRRTFASLSLVAGSFLIVFEARRIWLGQSGEEWFWLAVAMALTGLAAAELWSSRSRA